jgi:hypothetical protein
MILVGQVGLFWHPDLCIAVGALIAIGAVGLWVILKAKRWRNEGAESNGVSPVEQIDQYQKMVEEGLLGPEELARIKARLEVRADPTMPNTDVAPPSPSHPPDSSTHEK